MHSELHQMKERQIGEEMQLNEMIKFNLMMPNRVLILHPDAKPINRYIQGLFLKYFIY